MSQSEEIQEEKRNKTFSHQRVTKPFLTLWDHFHCVAVKAFISTLRKLCTEVNLCRSDRPPSIPLSRQQLIQELLIWALLCQDLGDLTHRKINCAFYQGILRDNVRASICDLNLKHSWIIGTMTQSIRADPPLISQSN